MSKSELELWNGGQVKWWRNSYFKSDEFDINEYEDGDPEKKVHRTRKTINRVKENVSVHITTSQACRMRFLEEISSDRFSLERDTTVHMRAELEAIDKRKCRAISKPWRVGCRGKLNIQIWGIIQPLAGFGISRGTGRYLGSKIERWQRYSYNYNFTFNCIPMLLLKGGEYSRILNLEMAGKQVFEASVFLLSFEPRFAISRNLVSY
jgi:hypothetical protein